MSGRVQREISHPCALTQSYDPVNFKYSETFSIAKINLSPGKPSVIKDLTIQGFYFKTLNAIDTPVSIAIAVGSAHLSDIIRGLNNPPAVNIQVDPMTGMFETYIPGVNDAKLDISKNDINPTRPQKFAFYDIPEANYSDNSAEGILNYLKIKEVFLAQGTTYNLANTEIKITDQAKDLFLIPFIAGLKKTEIACSFRARFTLLEV